MRLFRLNATPGRRRNTDYNKFVATNGTNMTVTPLTGAQQQFYYATSVLTGATGADGTLALTLAEPGGVGLKNVLTANLNDTPTANLIAAGGVHRPHQPGQRQGQHVRPYAGDLHRQQRCGV
ncbi:putative exported protein (RatA) [Salmonella enterica subsp. enterica]|nr:putative exported protein (RatA) [Salmonella enterica subsp. enterica]